MDKKILKLFEREKKKRMNELIQELLEDKGLENAKKNMEWIKFSDDLINSSSNSRKLFWSLIIGAVCIFIIGIAWTQHVQKTQVSFEVISPNVSLRLSQDWKLNKTFVTKMVYINSLDTVLAPELEFKFQRDFVNGDEPATLDLSGNNIKLKKLTIKDSVELHLTLNKNKLTFEVKGESLEGRLEVRQAKIVLTEENDDEVYETTKKLDKEDFEAIEFISSKTEGSPVKLELTTDSPWKISDFRTSKLKFIEEYPPGSGKFESTIKSGEVQFPETNATEELREGDKFLLQGIETRRLELSKCEEGIKVYFEGSVSAISAGPANYEKNLAPTYLEYIYHQQKLAFFWSGVVFLWGLLWSVKMTIFSK